MLLKKIPGDSKKNAVPGNFFITKTLYLRTMIANRHILVNISSPSPMMGMMGMMVMRIMRMHRQDAAYFFID